MLFEKITMVDYARPMAKRLESRKVCGPYMWSPSRPGNGRGFYLANKGLCVDQRGSTFDLRLEWANDHLGNSRLADITGYYIDSYEDETLQPIVARLPNGRGFLAGYTMGNSMASALDGTIWETIEDAARAAHDEAKTAAENSRDAEEDAAND
jgi:hypothetical protein